MRSQYKTNVSQILSGMLLAYSVVTSLLPRQFNILLLIVFETQVKHCILSYSFHLQHVKMKPY